MPILFLAALIVMPGWAGGHAEAADPPALPRRSILIEGDAGFLDPLSGVRGGSGTREDPYLIAHHVLLHDGPAALRLVGTRAHVLVDDIHVPRSIGHLGAAAHCAIETANPLCRASVGIELQDAQNVTFRRVKVDYDVYPMLLVKSQNVVLQDVAIGDHDELTFRPVVGIRIQDSMNVTAEGLHVRSASFPLQIFESRSVRVRSSILDGTFSDGHAFHVRSSEDIEVSNSTLLEIGIRLDGSSARFQIRANEFLGANSWIDGGLGHADDLLVCANDFRGAATLGAIYLVDGQRPTLRGNRIEGASRGVLLVAEGGLIEIVGNRVAGSHELGLWLVAYAPAIVRGNAFVGNAEGVYVPAPVDLRENWWGSASGPSGDGSGTGDKLVREGASVAYDPWLLAEPPLAGCESGA